MSAADWGQSGRRDAYTLLMVDPFTLQETGEAVDMADAGGSITYDIYGDNIYSASLKVEGNLPGGLIRVRHSVSLPGGTVADEDLGTLFTVPSDSQVEYRSKESTVKCYSPLYRFTNDVLVRDFVRPAGYNIWSEITELVNAEGGLIRRVDDALQDGGRTHTVQVSWPAGTKRSRVLNDLSGWTSSSLGVDDEGWLTWSPYRAPDERGVSYVFEAGSRSVYGEPVKYSTNAEDACNRALAYWSRDKVPTHSRVESTDADGTNHYAKGADGKTIQDPDDPYGLSDSAWADLPEWSPYSYEEIGRRATYAERVQDACSHEELRALAERRLAGRHGWYEYYEIQHAGIPGLRVGDVVEYVNDTDHTTGTVDCLCEVTQMKVSLQPGAWTESKLRVVRYL